MDSDTHGTERLGIPSREFSRDGRGRSVKIPEIPKNEIMKSRERPGICTLHNRQGFPLQYCWVTIGHRFKDNQYQYTSAEDHHFGGLIPEDTTLRHNVHKGIFLLILKAFVCLFYLCCYVNNEEHFNYGYIWVCSTHRRPTPEVIKTKKFLVSAVPRHTTLCVCLLD